MTKDQKIIRAKAGLLELAKQLGNVSLRVPVDCDRRFRWIVITQSS